MGELQDQTKNRFEQIKERMIESLVKNLPEVYVQSSGTSREKLGEILRNDSTNVITVIVESCAYEAEKIEFESARKHDA